MLVLWKVSIHQFEHISSNLCWVFFFCLVGCSYFFLFFFLFSLSKSTWTFNSKCSLNICWHEFQNKQITSYIVIYNVLMFLCGHPSLYWTGPLLLRYSFLFLIINNLCLVWHTGFRSLRVPAVPNLCTCLPLAIWSKRSKHIGARVGWHD